MLPRLRSRLALAAAPGLAVGALTAGLAVGAPAAQAQQPRLLSGTLFGEDGRAVSALLGIELRDASGNRIGATGCVESPTCRIGGHSITRRVNFELGPDGSRDLRRWDTVWAVAVPANADRAYVEVYPQGARFAGTDERRYGRSYRRNLRLPYDERVNLRVPVVCGLGGDTGSITGRATDDGRPVALKRITAFSLEADNNGPSPVLGFQIGSTSADGRFVLPRLASGPAKGQRAGQRYQVIATAEDGRVERAYGVRVDACRSVRVDIAF